MANKILHYLHRAESHLKEAMLQMDLTGTTIARGALTRLTDIIQHYEKEQPTEQKAGIVIDEVVTDQFVGEFNKTVQDIAQKRRKAMAKKKKPSKKKQPKPGY